MRAGEVGEGMLVGRRLRRGVGVSLCDGRFYRIKTQPRIIKGGFDRP